MKRLFDPRCRFLTRTENVLLARPKGMQRWFAATGDASVGRRTRHFRSGQETEAWEHVIGYAVVVGMILLGVPTLAAGGLSIPPSLISTRFGFRTPMLPALLGAWLWHRFPMGVVALVTPYPLRCSSSLFFGPGGLLETQKLTWTWATTWPGAEQWGIFLTGVSVATFVRWHSVVPRWMSISKTELLSG